MTTTQAQSGSDQSDQSNAAVSENSRWWTNTIWWIWILAGFCAVLLGGALLWKLRAGVVLNEQWADRAASIKASETINRQLYKSVSDYRDWLDQYAHRKEELVAEISQVENAVDQLSRRTQRLELVRDRLSGLNADFADFLREEKVFKDNLEKLRAASSSDKRSGERQVVR